MTTVGSHPVAQEPASPRVSVIMAAHNAERTVAAAVRSILWQTLTDLELVVVDDCSTDATHTVLQALAAADPRLRLLRNTRHRERSWSRNQAIEAASTELIAVLDADDIALPERLRQQAALLEQQPHLTLLGGGGYEMDEHTGIILAPYPPEANSGAILARMRRHNPFLHSSVVFRRQAAIEAGLYDPSMTASEDVDLFWRILRRGTARILPHPLVVRRVDWENERRVSRLRRTADLRTRWRGMQAHGESSPADWLFLALSAVRLGMPSTVDVRSRMLKRRLRKVLPPLQVREWVRACESGRRPSSAWTTAFAGSAGEPILSPPDRP